MARSDEKARIEGLIAEMTLAEKVGQLTMLSGELVQTGPASAPVTSEAIREGRVGSLLNLWGSEKVREVQRHAVEGSRLKIPLFFCLDVLYGLRTFFPIPFGEILRVRSRFMGAHGPGRRAGMRGRRHRFEFFAHDRRGARSTLGPNGRRSRRG